MADSPAWNTRSKLKQQGQREGRICHYRSRSCGVKSTEEAISTHLRSPSLDAVRERHFSRDSIQQGKVGTLRNKIEEIDVNNKRRSQGQLSIVRYFVQQIESHEALNEVRCRLFDEDDKKDNSTKVLSGNVTDENEDCPFDVPKPTGRDGDYTKDYGDKRKKISSKENISKDNTPEVNLNLNLVTEVEHLSPNRWKNVNIAEDINTKYNLGTSSEKEEEEKEGSEEKVEIFLRRKMEPENRGKKGDVLGPNNGSGVEEVQVSENMTMGYVYKMIATMNQHMTASLSTLQSTADDLKTRMMAMETYKIETNKKLTGLESQYQSCNNKITEIEVKLATQGTSITNLQKGKEEWVSKAMFNEVSGRLESANIDISKLKGLVLHQNTLIGELSAQCTLFKNKIFANDCCMMVLGIERKENENCVELVTKFIKKVLRVPHEITITKAYRVGNPQTSDAIVFYLVRVSLKDLIFKYVKNLKDVVNRFGKYYNIRDVLKGEENEVYRRAREVMFENRQLPFNNKLNLKMDKNQLKLEGERTQ